MTRRVSKRFPLLRESKDPSVKLRPIRCEPHAIPARLQRRQTGYYRRLPQSRTGIQFHAVRFNNQQLLFESYYCISILFQLCRNAYSETELTLAKGYARRVQNMHAQWGDIFSSSVTTKLFMKAVSLTLRLQESVLRIGCPDSGTSLRRENRTSKYA